MNYYIIILLIIGIFITFETHCFFFFFECTLIIPIRINFLFILGRHFIIWRDMKKQLKFLQMERPVFPLVLMLLKLV